jgi:hypothetical protein
VNVLGWKAASGEKPRNHRVRVPHVTDPKLIATPLERRDAGYEIEEAAGLMQVIAHTLGAFDRVGGVGDPPVPPPAHLIAEGTKPGQD